MILFSIILFRIKWATKKVWSQRLGLSSQGASRHLAAPSLGHYALQSLIVIGGSEIINFGYWILTPGFFDLKF
jgi:hypothetical protein